MDDSLKFRSEFGFEINGLIGKIDVSLLPSTEEGAEGFPICKATVEFDGDGYNSFFGWVQLVRFSDNSSEGREFEIDPFFLFQDTRYPIASLDSNRPYSMRLLVRPRNR